MTLVTRNLTNVGDPLCAPDGTALAGVLVRFSLVSGAGSVLPTDAWDATTHERVAGVVTATTNATGEFTVPLWINSRGTVATQYLCQVNHSSVRDFVASVEPGVGDLAWVDFMLAGAPITAAGMTALGEHITDPTAAHAASAISVSAISGVTGTEAQAVLAELAARASGGFDPAIVVAAASKATPVDADLLPLVDSAAGNVLKKVTWANLKATLKTYLDTLYGAVGVPITDKSANYTLVLADANTAIRHPSTDANARTFTIDSNANVPFPNGTAQTFINRSASALTIAITTDTMTLSGTTTTGSRTLAQNGIATAIKDSATGWLISGTGLT